jgi:excisionase family DNA binding protein
MRESAVIDPAPLSGGREFEPYLTKRQVAARLAVGVRTLERMVASAGLPAHRVGGHRRFLWSEVVAWVAAGERR